MRKLKHMRYARKDRSALLPKLFSDFFKRINILKKSLEDIVWPKVSNRVTKKFSTTQYWSAGPRPFRCKAEILGLRNGGKS